MVTRLPQTFWSDLAPLRNTSPPVIQHLVAQVAAQVTNAKQGVDKVLLARELESEGIEWSMKKIDKVMHALEILISAFFNMWRTQKRLEAAKKEEDEETEIEDAVEVTLDCLEKKSAFTKQSIVQALIDALQAEAEAAQGSVDEMFNAMKLQQLMDFQVVLEHEFSSAECKNVNITHATLIFTIGMDAGKVVHKRLCVSLHELKVIRQELRRIEEALQ